MDNSEKNKKNTVLHCDCHLKHERAIKNFDTFIQGSREDHLDIWHEVRKKTSQKIFLTLVTITIFGFGSLFGFLWELNKEIKDHITKMEINIERLKTTTEHHLEHNHQYKSNKR